MRPSQSVSTPVSPSEISKPVFAISKVLFTIFVKISVSPRKIRRTSPTMRAIRKNAIQM
jgi:hypothetical protein